MRVELTRTGWLIFYEDVQRYIPTEAVRAEVKQGELRLSAARESQVGVLLLQRDTGQDRCRLLVSQVIPGDTKPGIGRAEWDESVSALRIPLGTFGRSGYPDEALFAEVTVEAEDGQWMIYATVYFSDGARVHRVGRYFTEKKAQMAARIIYGSINRDSENLLEGW